MDEGPRHRDKERTDVEEQGTGSDDVVCERRVNPPQSRDQKGQVSEQVDVDKLATGTEDVIFVCEHGGSSSRDVEPQGQDSENDCEVGSYPPSYPASILPSLTSHPGKCV